jgi:hypothetical protein
MTVNQPGQQGCAAEINGTDAGRRIRLHSRRRTDFLDLAVFNEHGCWRKHIPSPGIEQSASFY